MQTYYANTLFNAQASLGEGPVWLGSQLLWIDIQKGRIHLFDPLRRTDVYREIGYEVGAAVPTTREDVFLLATRHGFEFLDWRKGLVKPLRDPESDLPGNRFNDGKCDPRGRFFAGSLGPAGEAAFYRMDASQEVTRLLDKVTISNGLAWSIDESTFYYIDTPTQQVVTFAYDPDSGEISNRRVLLEVPRETGSPDGMTIDENDNLWVALWNGSGVHQYDGRTGEQLARIEVPAQNVTSCTFGGPEMKTLYITTAGGHHDQWPEAGNLFTAELPVRGLPPARFPL